MKSSIHKTTGSLLTLPVTYYSINVLIGLFYPIHSAGCSLFMTIYKIIIWHFRKANVHRCKDMVLIMLFNKSIVLLC